MMVDSISDILSRSNRCKEALEDKLGVFYDRKRYFHLFREAFGKNRAEAQFQKKNLNYIYF